ncbi:neural cell adhesion molecule 2-like [Mytilus edulis]|uniref:neural cell adhesion molecule 2-like n=1 Tax=Mytilus edulis TaxID=6550 RepID=UPI0039EE5755
MELINIFLTFIVVCISFKLATGKPDPPKDVRIHVIGRTAKISWTIPSNIERATYSRIIITDSRGADIYLKGSSKYKDILLPETSSKIANLKLFSEYSVKLQFLSPYSEVITHKFWMTNKNVTTDINQNVALSWTTSLTGFFSALPPGRSPVIYTVQAGSLFVNFEDRKYRFEKKPQDVRAINITVIRVSAIDAGLYSTENGGIVDGCCLLIVTTKPVKPTVTIQSAHPFVGENITVTCNSVVQRWPGYCPSHLSYHFNGNKRGESNNNRLTINNITKLDKGTILACRATDELGKRSLMSDSVILDPYYGPENVVLEPAIPNINVTEGTTLGPIYCIATCNPRCIYKWKQNWTGKFNIVPNEYSSKQGRGVTVPAIKRSQTGTYRCRINHSTGDVHKTKDISVNVQYSPKITDIWFSSGNQRKRVRTPATFSFNEEENAKMTLRVESNPDSKIIFRSSLLKIQQTNKGNEYTDYTCNLSSLKCEDSGNFSILASNGIPYGDTSIVNLKIQCKPRNVPPESRTIGAKIDTVENIVLQVISFPTPTVTWVSRTGSIWKVQKDRYDYRHKIYSKIRIGSERDFGVYGIRICNQLGCIVENITLKPQDKPEAPQNVSVVTTTFRSVNISWIAGFNGGHEQTFSVQFKATDDVTWNTKNVENNDIKTGNTVYYTLDQLKPDTSYQVVVVSTNLQGQRNASLEFKTEVEPTVKSPLKSASMTPIFIGIGCGIALILIVVTSLYVFCIRRNRGSTNESTESNVLYAAVDKIQQKIKRRNPENENEDSNAPANAEYASVVKPKSKSKKVHYKEDEIEKENDEYAVVDKSNKKIHYTENANVHSNQGNADLLIHQPLKTKPSGRSKNQDGLTYIEVSFTRKPKDRRRIIGAENRTNYVDIDFTRKADPLPESSDE